MKTIKTILLDGSLARICHVSDDGRSTKIFNIVEIHRKYANKNMFVIYELRKILFFIDRWKLFYDKNCFERNIPLVFKSAEDAEKYITKL